MWLRIALVGALSLALSGISILCCYVFGTHLAPGLEGQIYGALGAVADALKAFLPLAIAGALAAQQKGRAAAGTAMFAVFSFYSFTSELGLYALGRNAVASDAVAAKEAYEAAKADRGGIASRLKELGPQRPTGAVQADIDAAKQSALWRSSESCTQATGQAARTFCTGFEKLKGELASAQEAERLREQDGKLSVKLSGFDLAAVMRSSDPQSEALSRFTGFSSQSIRDALAVLVALLIELGSGLGLWVATAGTRATRPTPEAPRETEPVAVAVAAFAPAPQEATPIEIEPDQPAAIAPPVIEPEPKRLAAIEAPARAPQKPVETASVIEAPSPIEEEPKAFPAPLRPRLIASRSDPVGNVAVIMAEILEPGRGKVEIEDVFAAYAQECKHTGKRPIPANEFSEAIADLCKQLNIKIEATDKGVYLLKVRLKKSGKSANA